MKRILVLCLLLAAGCTPAAIKNEVRLNAVRCERYVELMEKKETTPLQDRDFVKANAEAWKALSDRWE